MFKLVVLSSVLALAASSAIAPLGLGVHGLGVPGVSVAGLGVPGVSVAGLGVPGVGVAGLGWAGAWGGNLGAWGGHLGAPAHVAAPLAVAPALGAYNYRGPLSLGPGQPANILAADGRPLDTISVNLDRAAHLTARAVDGHGWHLLKKRSAPLLAPAAAWSHTARVDWPARIVAPAHLAAPVVSAWGHAAPLARAGAWGHAAPLAHAGAWGPAAPWGLW